MRLVSEGFDLTKLELYDTVPVRSVKEMRYRNQLRFGKLTTAQIVEVAEEQRVARDEHRMARHMEFIRKATSVLRFTTISEMQMVIAAEEYIDRNHYLTGSQRFALKILYERYVEQV